MSFHAYLNYKDSETRRLSPNAIPRTSLPTWKDSNIRKSRALNLYQTGILQRWLWYPKIPPHYLEHCFRYGEIYSSKAKDCWSVDRGAENLEEREESEEQGEEGEDEGEENEGNWENTRRRTYPVPLKSMKSAVQDWIYRYGGQ
jgi:hypothetical protein